MVAQYNNQLHSFILIYYLFIPYLRFNFHIEQNKQLVILMVRLNQMM